MFQSKVSSHIKQGHILSDSTNSSKLMSDQSMQMPKKDNQNLQNNSKQDSKFSLNPIGKYDFSSNEKEKIKLTKIAEKD